MAVLSKPHEIYEWRDGETKVFSILRSEEGELEIHPRDGRPAKLVNVIRIHVPPEEKNTYPPYWDLTSQRLVGQLKSILPAAIVSPFRVQISAIGRAPTTHYSVSRLPERPA
jgi:hypothetical protein